MMAVVKVAATPSHAICKRLAGEKLASPSIANIGIRSFPVALILLVKYALSLKAAAKYCSTALRNPGFDSALVYVSTKSFEKTSSPLY